MVVPPTLDEEDRASVTVRLWSFTLNLFQGPRCHKLGLCWLRNGCWNKFSLTAWKGRRANFWFTTLAAGHWPNFWRYAFVSTPSLRTRKADPWAAARSDHRRSPGAADR